MTGGDDLDFPRRDDGERVTNLRFPDGSAVPGRRSPNCGRWADRPRSASLDGLCPRRACELGGLSRDGRSCRGSTRQAASWMGSAEPSVAVLAAAEPYVLHARRSQPSASPLGSAAVSGSAPRRKATSPRARLRAPGVRGVTPGDAVGAVHRTVDSSWPTSGGPPAGHASTRGDDGWSRLHALLSRQAPGEGSYAATHAPQVRAPMSESLSRRASWLAEQLAEPCAHK